MKEKDATNKKTKTKHTHGHAHVRAHTHTQTHTLRRNLWIAWGVFPQKERENYSQLGVLFVGSLVICQDQRFDVEILQQPFNI